MGEEALVESRITDAVSLIRDLDARKESPSFVVWYFYDDAEEWRLLIAGPAFDELLPKQEHVAYRKVIDALSTINPSSLSISEIKLVRSDSSLPKALSFLIHTGPNGFVRAHFSNTTLNGIFIKEMVILRSA